MRRFTFFIALTFFFTQSGNAQGFSLEKETDSLYYLTYTVGDRTDSFSLPFPVMKWQVGDVDGNGTEDAMVMVVKKTRFDERVLPRLFIFKQINGKVRPLWLGSQLGGILCDFRYANGKVISLQSTTDSLYVVMTHKWRKFGLGADSILIGPTDHAMAMKTFNMK